MTDQKHASRNLLSADDPHHHADNEILVELPNNERWMGELEVGVSGLITFVGVKRNSPLEQAGITDGAILQQIGFTKLLPRDLVFACSTIRREKKISLALHKATVAVFYVPATTEYRKNAIKPLRGRGDKRRHGHNDQMKQKINPVDGRTFSRKERKKNNSYHSRIDFENYNESYHHHYDFDLHERESEDSDFNAANISSLPYFDEREDTNLYYHKTRGGSSTFTKFQKFQRMVHSKKFKKKVDDSFQFHHEIDGDGTHRVIVTWKD
jgi:hypothetical protein